MSGNSYYPKVLSSPAAKTYADLFLVQEDLKHVAKCCDEILTRGVHPLTCFISRALLDSAVIRYRRCFNSGVRTRLDDHTRDWPETDLKLHEFFRHLGSLHIAHSVNAFERACAQVFIATNTDGTLLRGGLGLHGGHTLELSLNEVSRLGSFARTLTESTKQWSKEVSAELSAQVETMSDADLLALEDGGQLARDHDVKKRRA